MDQDQTDLLTESFLQLYTTQRKELLPWWVKTFCWIFLIFGFIAFPAIIFGILGYKFQLNIYGLETSEPISFIGISIVAIFLFKGITAYSLLSQKKWGIVLGIVDAITGIVICTFFILYSFLNFGSHQNLGFRLEILFLVPYFLKMIKIKTSWENSINI
jgi:hypothetical protein